jgi:NAD(P)H-hydrate repair Nnr-like enzyme with NAD(P)H-hydrate dehydratase domain
VLTLNPGELAQVLGIPDRQVTDDPSGAVHRLVAATGAVVLLGAEEKLVAEPSGRTWTVTAGGAGLATAGSGDVQAGLVAGLLARGAEPAQAAVWAAWLHATAGDRLAGGVGRFGFLARELPAEVPALLDEVAG